MEQVAEPVRPTSVIAARVRDLRQRHGWTADQLAEQMTAVGIPWSRIVVTKLETGRRPSVSVEEFLALAYVLDVAPVHLLVPPLDTDDQTPYQVTPSGVTTTPAVARLWIRGQSPVGDVDPKRYFSEVPDSEWVAPGARDHMPYQGYVKAPTWKPAAADGER